MRDRPTLAPLPPLADVPDDRRLNGIDKQTTEDNRQDKETQR